MSIEDSVAGTAKRLVGEIVGDGRLADDGTSQAAHGTSAESSPQAQSDMQPNAHPATADLSQGAAARFAALFGRAALKTWADLPRDAQERLFAAAVDDGVIANDLAEFLHDHHPKTAHPGGRRCTSCSPSRSPSSTARPRGGDGSPGVAPSRPCSGWLSPACSFYAANFGKFNETYGSLGAVIGVMTWLWISAIVVLLGAEIDAEMEHQTGRGTTTGSPKPLGARGARLADTIGEAQGE